MSYKPQVETANEPGKFYGNALAFATEQEALDSARDLSNRWTFAEQEALDNVHDLSNRWMLVTNYRAIQSDDPVNYRWSATEGLQHI